MWRLHVSTQEHKPTFQIMCCVLCSLRLDQFPLIRYKLKKQNLIKEGPDEVVCGQRDGQGHCYVALATHSCSFKVWILFKKHHASKAIP